MGLQPRACYRLRVQEEQALPPRRGLRVGSLTILLMILFVPYLMTLQVQKLSGGAPVESGPQPGGTLRGQVHDGDGQPLADLEVELYLADREGARERLASASSDEQGFFEFEAPPCEGHYLVHIGGGPWRRLVRPLSLIGSELVAGDVLPELEFELRPGASLEVELVRKNGREVVGGVLRLNGQLGASWPWNRLSPGVHLEQEFQGSTVLIDGLPPLRGEVQIDLEGGARLKFELELDEKQSFEQRFEF